ncbi:MAG TPA: cation diffusion facilitator family transporter, partial [Sandaracinaceae bacterium]
FEVVRGAVVALTTGARPDLGWAVAAVFASKVAFKGTIAILATRAARGTRNPVLDALRVDSRNDVLVGAVALVGFALVRAGLPAMDAWLAIAVAGYVAYAGLRLARDNVGLLMGAAAPAKRRAELLEVARAVPGVRRIDALVATWSGPCLHVHCDIAVDRGLSLLEAHEIGHAVEARLLREDDVAHAVVHVGPYE